MRKRNKSIPQLHCFGSADFGHGLDIPRLKPQAGLLKFGDDNNYPEELLRLYNESSTHKSIINRKAKWLFGEVKFTQAHKGLEGFLNNFDGEGSSYEDVLLPFCRDYYIYGAGALLVYKNVQGTRVTRAEYLSSRKLRIHLDEQKEWIGFGCADAWSYSTKAQYFPKLDLHAKELVQVLYFRNNASEIEHYGLPNYLSKSAIASIKTQFELLETAYLDTKNGFAPSIIIEMQAKDLRAQQKEELERRFKDKFSGAKGERNMLIINDIAQPNAAKTAVHHIPKDRYDKSFEAIRLGVKEDICEAHEFFPKVLASIATQGALGGKDNIQEQYDIYYNDVIKPDQLRLTRVLNQLLAFNSFPLLSLEKKPLF